MSTNTYPATGVVALYGVEVREKGEVETDLIDRSYCGRKLARTARVKLSREPCNSFSMNKTAEEKTWNRVLQPPGGRSSIQLSWEESSDRVHGECLRNRSCRICLSVSHYVP